MRAPDGGDAEALNRMSDAVEPEEVEDLVQTFSRAGWENAADECPECGSTDLRVRNLELETMLDSEETYGPQPARVVCEGCKTLLFEHPKWRAFQIFGDEYAYTEV